MLSFSSPESAANRRRLLVLLACVGVAMVGFGITLPVLPFYAERLMSQGPTAARDVAVRVSVLTAVYPLMQLLFAPFWGHWSDSLGRRRLVLVGIAGATIGQIMFAMSASLAGLYAARVIGGVLSAAIFPAAAAYVADSTAEGDRGRAMALLGTAVSLGVVVGPALGGGLAQTGWELRSGSGATLIASFAVPFLAAALLGLVALVAAFAWLPESQRAGPPLVRQPFVTAVVTLAKRDALRELLILAVAVQFGLALFEATFALYARRMWSFGPAEVGAVFMTCGLVMSLAQTGLAAVLSRLLPDIAQIALGFGLVGGSLALLPFARQIGAVVSVVAVLALGVALITPRLSALIATRASARTGGALGIQSAANSLGQLGGTLLGGVLLGWRMEAPYVVAASLLVLTGVGLGWRTRKAVPQT